MHTILRQFFRELTENKMREEIEELKKEIRRLESEYKVGKKTTKDKKPKDDKKKIKTADDKTRVVLVLIALFNNTASGRKQKKSLQKHISKSLKPPIEDYSEIYSEIISIMLNNGFLMEKGASYIKQITGMTQK